MQTKSLARSAVALLTAGILLAGCDGITDPNLAPPDPRVDPGSGAPGVSAPAGQAGS
ncbi:MAG TPA: hypothetical protein VF746_21090 [Longimicrobium sp.]|jgi:hypothetical protein